MLLKAAVGAGLLLAGGALSAWRAAEHRPIARQTSAAVARSNLWNPDERIVLDQAQMLPGVGRLGSDKVHSILNVPKRLTYGDFVWNDRLVPAGRIWIRVDLDAQLMSVFRGGHEIGTAVILYGAEQKETPVGSFPVLAKLRDHRSSLYDASMPYTLRLTPDGVSIHGNNVRWGTGTHGCIGIPDEFAKKLFGQVTVGDVVTIVAGSGRDPSKIAA